MLHTLFAQVRVFTRPATLVAAVVLLALMGSSAFGAPAALSGVFAPAAAPPTLVSYQGFVKVSGSPFTGTGYFKFAVMDAASGNGTTNYWANDGAISGEPSASVALAVTGGLFDVMLGDTSLAGMTQAIDQAVFTQSTTYLRVWFSQTAGGPFQTLDPNQRIGSAAYALRATRAESATDADQLGGVAASSYLQTTSSLNAPNLVGMAPLASIPPIPWSNLTSVPSGFADGVDNDTTYNAGSNLTLTGNTFALANPLSGDLAMGGNRITGLAAPVSSSDAANKSYVDTVVDAGDATKLSLSGGMITGSLAVAGTTSLQDVSAASAAFSGPVKVGSASSAPSGPTAGTMYWNTSSSSMQAYNGTQWTPLNYTAGSNLTLTGNTFALADNVSVTSVTASSSVKIGNVSLTCASGAAGTVRWSGTTLEVCDGSTWAAISTSSNRKAFRARLSADATYGGGWQAVSFGTEDFDDANGFSTTTYTVPPGPGTLYHFDCRVNTLQSSPGILSVGIAVNGNLIAESTETNPYNNIYQSRQVSADVKLTPGQVVQCQSFNSGGTYTVLRGPTGPVYVGTVFSGYVVY